MSERITREELGNRWKRVINHPAVTEHRIYNSRVFDPDFQSSVWYDQEVVSITLFNRFEVYIRAAGEVDVRAEDDDDDRCYTEDEVERAKWFEKKGIMCDNDLGSDKIYFEDSNWFELCAYDLVGDKHISDDWYYDLSTWETYPVDIDVDEVLDLIKDYLKEEVEYESAYHVELNGYH